MRPIALLLATNCLLVPAVSWACMPPPPGTPAILIQTRYLESAISDAVVQDAIKAQGLNVSILAIELDAGIQFRLTNGCQFKVSKDFKGALPGTCPELLPTKLIDIVGCGE
jgi:hypothetical protein